MKRLVLYPFLFVLYVILNPLAHNLDQLNPSLALRPLAFLFLAVASELLLFYILFKDWRYAGYLVFLVTLYFFALGYLSRFVQDQLTNFGKVLNERVFLAICTGLLGIFAFKGVWVRLGGRSRMAPFLNLVIALGLLFPAYGLAVGFIRAPFQVSSNTKNNFGEMVLDCSNTPDIYYIILDGYGRADVLEEMYGLDNRPFLDYLIRQGFYVATDSYTNYIQTVFSIPSSLNFRYIDPPENGVSGQRYFWDLLRHNDIIGALKHCGYRSVSIETGFSYTDHLDVDTYLERGIGPNEFESLLLADSPVDVLASELKLEPLELSTEAHRQRVLFSFEKLATLYKMTGPKFVFAHIISPHPPFVFNKAGQPIEPKHSYYIGDGDDYQGVLDEYLAGYPEQVQFVNQKLEQVFDALLANSSIPPVIIIQGDHGPGSHLVWDSPSQTCLWERTPILNAYYLPGE
ncbi:MAG: sulfatase-like hydrolase/transferase, partial [Candidatus Thorarchaeota archaeon]